MKKFFYSALCAAFMASAGIASAASLGLNVVATPLLSGQGYAFNDPSFAGFDLIGSVAGDSLTPPIVGDLEVLVPSAILDLSDPVFGGVLFVTDENFLEFLSGDLIDVGFLTTDDLLTDTIELLFGNLGGNASFGRQVLLTLVGEFGDYGDNPITDGFASATNPNLVSFTIVPVAPIPLPATAPLLLTALIGAGLAVRRKRHRWHFRD